MIVDNSLPDLVMLNILRKLRKKWGMKVCVKNVRTHLIEWKQVFAPFFKNEFLTADSENCFCDKDGNPIPRRYTYCSDVHAVIEIIKKNVPKLESDEYFMVLAIDGGKNNLKICLNYIKREKR